MVAQDTQSELVVMGRIGAPYGVRGWVKIQSATDPIHGIFDYKPWLMKIDGQLKEMTPCHFRHHGQGLIAQFEECQDRNQAQLYTNIDIMVNRSQLSELEDGQYYWSDLEGLNVVTQAGVELGKIDHLFDTGANDVIVVKGDKERLIPYRTGEVVLEVDLAQGKMVVDWDPEF